MTGANRRIRWFAVGLLSALGAVACTYHTYDVAGGEDAGPSSTDSASAASTIDLFLQGVLAPLVAATPSGCIFSDFPTQRTLSKGVLDVEVVKSFSDTYQAVFLAGNQLAATGNPRQPGSDPSRIIIHGATVRVTDASGKQLADFTSTGSASIGPASAAGPGFGHVQFTIVDSATVDSLRAQLGPFERVTLVTYTQALGQTLGGEHLASNVFEFAITACKGCLIQFDTNLAVTPAPNCFSPMAMSTPSSCFYGQDVLVDCHLCKKDPFCLHGAVRK